MNEQDSSQAPPEPSPRTTGGPLAWMANNSVAANLLMLFFLVGGALLAWNVKQEVFPEFDLDAVRITVPYPGASPEEVEQGVVLAIEDRIRGLDGIKRVTSSAYEGSGVVVAELLLNTNANKIFQDIKNEIDRITTFPEDAETPTVALADRVRVVVNLIVYGDQSEKAIRNLAERIQDDLIQTDGITLVELGLTPPLEIAVEISQENLRAYGLTLEEVAQLIRRTALELPGGEIRTESGRILLRTRERRDYGKQFHDIPVATNSEGALVTLGDIATIKDGFQEADQEASFDGMPAVGIDVYRVGEETPQQVAAAVKAYVEKLTPQLPDGVSVKVWDDDSEKYTDRMSLLMKNAVLGLVLVLVLLGLFLEVRLAFWVTLGIPISILGSFLFIPVFDTSINMVSLFAFIITLGIIVDDAVVMGENIYEHRERGFPIKLAAILGARNIATPITFAVLTNIVAFLPLFFVPGTSGKIFMQIPAIVVSVFFVSLIESLFILPSHLSHRLSNAKIWQTLNSPQRHCEEKLKSFITLYYAPMVERAIRNRYITIAIALALLCAAFGAVMGGHIKVTHLPRIESDVIKVQATLPFDAPLQTARNIQKRLVASAKEVIQKLDAAESVKGIYSQIGGQVIAGGHGSRGEEGGHILAAEVSLVSSEDRDFSAATFSRQWRKELSDVVGLETLQFDYEIGGGSGAAIELNLSHRSKESAEAAAKELGRILAGYAGVFDIDDGVEGGKRQFSFQVTPYAQSLGLTAEDLGRQVRASFYGAEALRQQRGRNEVKVLVRLPLEDRERIQTMENFVVRTPNGDEIPLLEAANITEGKSYTKIVRRDGQRVITVTADVDEKVSNAASIIENVLGDEFPVLQQKYPGLSSSLGGREEERAESMGALFVGFLLSMIAIYGLLAVPLKSYAQPVVIMLGIPFGMIGAVLGHFLLGYNLSIISMFGLIALSGVVVNDSLVLIVTANDLRNEGKDAEEAIKLAGIRRFRPIILTSLTTFLGLAPMIFETSIQARFLIPMAISLGFGILASTVIILALVPAVYMMIEDVGGYVRKMFSGITYYE